jgi:hypothetical protein
MSNQKYFKLYNLFSNNNIKMGYKINEDYRIIKNITPLIILLII